VPRRARASRVDWADKGLSALHHGDNPDYDVIVLDLGLPEIIGLAVLKLLRADAVHTPLLCLTARHTVNYRVLGLRLVRMIHDFTSAYPGAEKWHAELPFQEQSRTPLSAFLPSGGWPCWCSSTRDRCLPRRGRGDGVHFGFAERWISHTTNLQLVRAEDGAVSRSQSRRCRQSPSWLWPEGCRG
jgi:hypothetical protein